MSSSSLEVMGFFSSFDLSQRGHYEVFGEGTGETEAASATSRPVVGPGRFSFQRPSAAAGSASMAAASNVRASMVKPFQRNLFLADLVDGKWLPQKSVAIRFFEYEASVPGIMAKAQEALGTEDNMILTDSQGNEIMDTDGTKGSVYWKQNSRKIFVVPEEQFRESRNKKRRLSRRDDISQLPEVAEKIEEVVLAAQELSDVSQAIRELTNFASANRRQTLSFTQDQIAALKDAFACLVCKGPMIEPFVTICCKSLVACQACIEQWLLTSNQCLKCRADNCRENSFRLTVLGGALSSLGDVIKD